MASDIPQTTTAPDRESDSTAVRLDGEGAASISEKVLLLIRDAFDPYGRHRSVTSPGRAFVTDVIHLAQQHGVDLSETDLAELCAAGLKLDMASQTAEWISDALGDPSQVRDPFSKSSTLMGWHRAPISKSLLGA